MLYICASRASLEAEPFAVEGGVLTEDLARIHIKYADDDFALCRTLANVHALPIRPSLVVVEALYSHLPPGEDAVSRRRRLTRIYSMAGGAVGTLCRASEEADPACVVGAAADTLVREDASVHAHFTRPGT